MKIKTNHFKERQKKWDAYHKFEKQHLKKTKLSFKEALAIFGMLWREAKTFGVFNKRKLMEDIEKDIRIAKILNKA